MIARLPGKGRREREKVDAFAFAFRRDLDFGGGSPFRAELDRAPIARCYNNAPVRNARKVTSGFAVVFAALKGIQLKMNARARSRAQRNGDRFYDENPRRDLSRLDRSHNRSFNARGPTFLHTRSR